MTQHDPRALRDAFGAFTTGVTVVTTVDDDGEPSGFTANSFTSVSLDPPLVLVCIDRLASRYDTFSASTRFAVNVLSESQRELSKTFAMPSENRFAGVRWSKGPNGSPVLEDVAAWFDCSMHKTIDAGDHLVLIGRIEAFHDAGANGLGYARGAYFTPSLSERAMEVAASDRSVMLGAIIARAGHVLILPGDGDSLRLPMAPLKASANSESDLGDLLTGLGLPVTHGFVYAVYVHAVTGDRHIVYRCQAANGTPRQGEFMSPRDIPFERFSDAAEVTMLKRYADESRIGNYGVYFGSDQSGAVHRSNDG